MKWFLNCFDFWSIANEIYEKARKNKSWILSIINLVRFVLSFFLIQFCASDINECNVQNVQCIANASCVNGVGNFSCECDMGFTGSNDTSCQGILMWFYCEPVKYHWLSTVVAWQRLWANGLFWENNTLVLLAVVL